MEVAMEARFKVVAQAFFLCLITSPAIAAEKENSSSLILSGGRSVAQNACLSPLVAVSDPGFECAENHTIYRIAYNYKFTPAWGIEVSGGDLGDANGTGTLAGLDSTWQMKANGWTIAGIGNFTIGDSFSLFGKLGFVRAQLHEENYRQLSSGVWEYRYAFNGQPITNLETTALTYGVGFQYDFTKTFGLRVQYENFGQYDLYSHYGVSTPEKVSLTAASAGLVVSF
jgi:opacity protein-like surface antigen